MYKKLNYKISKVDQNNRTAIYNIGSENSYIISNPDTIDLLCNPEMTGYIIRQKLYTSIKDSLEFLSKNTILNNVNILNILRGGLNFPIENASFDIGLNVDEVSFLTSERIFMDDKVSRIETKYRKIACVPNATIILGDIVASGETLYNAIEFMVEKYVFDKKLIDKIVIFTIGTTNTLSIIRKIESELKERWSNFKGIYTFFFEAIFTTYDSTGITGLNLPHVDFTFTNALLSPEYRKSLIEKPYIVFEKCAIYDGGARRFEKKTHIDTITKYWNDLCVIGKKIKLQDFYREKMGYDKSSIFPNWDDWMALNCYSRNCQTDIDSLYLNEKDFFHKLQYTDLSTIAKNRHKNLLSYYSR